jgi:hypothetical protein
MVKIFGQNEADAQTHVFIVGIGHYPYLSGGTEARVQVKTGLSSLQQLTCPQQSALAVYRAFESLHLAGSLALPLGSITMLVSDFPGSPTIPPELQTAPATRANVKSAYQDWKSRCKKNKQNTAIFFFCGHGLHNGQHQLLTQEFGEDPELPYDGAFNFDHVRQAFDQEDVKTQLFLIDACRDVPIALLEENASFPDIDIPHKAKQTSTYHTTIWATAPNEGSYGAPGQPTFFTKAILKALQGNVSRRRSNQWVVETSDICSHINQLMEMEKEGEGHKQRCEYLSRVSAPLTRSDSPTERLLEVSCDPEQATAHARFSCQNAKHQVNLSREPHPANWRVSIPAGIYHVSAIFPNAAYPDADNDEVYVDLPITYEKLSCQ